MAVTKKVRLKIEQESGTTYRLVIALRWKYESFCTDRGCSEISLSIFKYCKWWFEKWSFANLYNFSSCEATLLISMYSFLALLVDRSNGAMIHLLQWFCSSWFHPQYASSISYKYERMFSFICSFFSVQGTHVEHTFHMFRWSRGIWSMVSFDSSYTTPSTLTDMCRSCQMMAATIFINSSLTRIDFFPRCRSNAENSKPSQKDACHLNTVAILNDSSVKYAFSAKA